MSVLEMVRRLLELAAVGLAVTVTLLVVLPAGTGGQRWVVAAAALLAATLDAALRPGKVP